MKYSVVVPVYCSEHTLDVLYQELISVMESLRESFELIFVDDCSSDNSWKKIQSLSEIDDRLIAVQLMKNSGQGNATLAGFSKAQGAIVITLDDDLQHPPAQIPKLIEALNNDTDLDVVIGVPIERKDSAFRKVGSYLLNRINSWFIGKDPRLRFTAFRVIRKEIVNVVLSMSFPSPHVGPLIYSVTHRVKNVSVEHNSRHRGRSTYSLSGLVQLAVNLLVGYSMLPMRILAVLGFIGSIVSIFLAIYFLVQFFLYGTNIPGWTSILLVLLTLTGFNFIAFGFIGEYILRIMQISSKSGNWNIRGDNK